MGLQKIFWGSDFLFLKRYSKTKVFYLNLNIMGKNIFYQLKKLIRLTFLPLLSTLSLTLFVTQPILAEKNTSLSAFQKSSSSRAQKVAQRKQRRKVARALRRGLPVVKNLTFFPASGGKALAGYRRVSGDIEVNLREHESDRFLIRVNVNKRTTKKLKVFLDGTRQRLRNAFVFSAREGTHSLELIPYALKRDQQSSGSPVRITLSVVNKSEPKTAPTPNPELIPPPPESPGVIGDDWVIQDSVIYHDGEAFFPFGMYHVTHYTKDRQKRLDDIHTLAGIGVNMLHTPLTLSDRELLDLCDSYGIKVIMEFNDSPENLIAQFKSHPAMAGLGTFDDVDANTSDGSRRHPVNTVRRRSAELKSLAPGLLTYSSGGWPDRIAEYLGATELLGMQSYPVPFERLYALTTGYYRNFAKAAEPYGWIANLQTFGWYGSHRLPTRRELRNMTYQSLLLGAHGIIYYAYFDVVTDLEKHPGILSELSLLSQEVSTLKNVFLFGTRELLGTGNPQVFAAKWRYQEKLYVIVVNGNENESREAQVSLNEKVTSTGSNFFPERETGLRLDGNTLRGNLAPADVHVYRFN